LRRQQDLIAVIKDISKKKLNQKESEALIADYIKHFEYGRHKAQQDLAKKREETTLELATFVVQITTDEQKKYAFERIETWIADINSLIKESSALAAKKSALLNR
jgi:predicted transcriptional regulator